MIMPQAPRVYSGRTSDFVLLVLKGRLHYLAARPLRGCFEEVAAEARERTLVIDLRAVDAIDSTGMGLLARLGRRTLEHGRRSVIVCQPGDVSICLRSAAFDRLFMVLNEDPIAEEVTLQELVLTGDDVRRDQLGRVMLDAHRALSDLSEYNRQTYVDVVSALEAEEQAGTRTANR